MANHQSYSQVSYSIAPPPHVVSAAVWSNGVLAGAVRHINGVEKDTRSRMSELTGKVSGAAVAQHLRDRVDGVDPAVTTGERT